VWIVIVHSPAVGSVRLARYSPVFAVAVAEADTLTSLYDASIDGLSPVIGETPC
jgi:hypothetical protein